MLGYHTGAKINGSYCVSGMQVGSQERTEGNEAGEKWPEK